MSYFEVKELSFCYKLQSEPLWLEDEAPSAAEEEPGASIENISFGLDRGELLLISGESGCGKTTILRCINGIIPEFYDGELKGDVLLEGRSLKNLMPHERGRLIGSVFQNPRSQFFNVRVRDEIYFGCENIGLPSDKIAERAEPLIKAFNMEDFLERSLFELSGGEKQRVACLSVGAMLPKVILYDEPSSNLDEKGMNSLRELMGYFKQKGVTQIVSEHRLSYLESLADKALLIKEGVISERFSGEAFRALGEDELRKIGLRTNRNVNVKPSRLFSFRGMGADKPAEDDLYISRLEMRYGGRREKTLLMGGYGFERGVIHAILSENGKGKSSFLRSLCGLEAKEKGKIIWQGKQYSPRAFRRNCAMVFQDVNHQLLTASVYEEWELNARHLSPEERQNLIDYLADMLDLRERLSRHPLSLSGGQKQRLALGSALISRRPVILLDEPTSGLDLGHMLSLAGLLKDISRNKWVIVATHDKEFIRALGAVVHGIPEKKEESL